MAEALHADPPAEVTGGTGAVVDELRPGHELVAVHPSGARGRFASARSGGHAGASPDERDTIRPARRDRPDPLRFPRGAIVYLGFVLVFVVFAILLRERGFLTIDNQLNILRQTAFVSIMAFGTTFALSAGEIDLSIGQVVALERDGRRRAAARTQCCRRGAWAGCRWASAVGLANGLLTTGCGCRHS